MGDVVLVERFANDLEAQAAASALRDAGLHPVVLGRDPLAQLSQPFQAVRLLVPEEEREAARELLGLAAAAGGEAPAVPDRAGRGWRLLALAAAWVILLLALAFARC